MAKKKKTYKSYKETPKEFSDHLYAKMDYDYLAKLSLEDRQWLKQFDDEYYKASYMPINEEKVTNKKPLSVFVSPKGLEELMQDEVEYTLFLMRYIIELEKTNKTQEKLTELEFYASLRRRHATSHKGYGKEDIFNGAAYNKLIDTEDLPPLSEDEDAMDKVTIDKSVPLAKYIEETADLCNSEDVNNAYKLLKQGKFFLFLSNKLMELLDDIDWIPKIERLLSIEEMKLRYEIFDDGLYPEKDYIQYLQESFDIIKDEIDPKEKKSIEMIFKYIIFGNKKSQRKLIKEVFGDEKANKKRYAELAKQWYRQDYSDEE